MQPEFLDRKVTDRNFLDRYIYPIGSGGAIKTNMATKCFYEFMSALSNVITGTLEQIFLQYFKIDCLFATILKTTHIKTEACGRFYFFERGIQVARTSICIYFNTKGYLIVVRHKVSMKKKKQNLILLDKNKYRYYQSIQIVWIRRVALLSVHLERVSSPQSAQSLHHINI